MSFAAEEIRPLIREVIKEYEKGSRIPGAAFDTVTEIL